MGQCNTTMSIGEHPPPNQLFLSLAMGAVFLAANDATDLQEEISADFSGHD